MGIARRVLATLRRYMLSGEAQDAGADRPSVERIEAARVRARGRLNGQRDAAREHAVGLTGLQRTSIDSRA